MLGVANNSHDKADIRNLSTLPLNSLEIINVPGDSAKWLRHVLHVFFHKNCLGTVVVIV